jgi:hypothetical protein
MDEFNKRQYMRGVRETRLQRHLQYLTICSAEEENRGADAMQVYGAVSQT